MIRIIRMEGINNIFMIACLWALNRDIHLIYVYFRWTLQARKSAELNKEQKKSISVRQKASAGFIPGSKPT